MLLKINEIRFDLALISSDCFKSFSPLSNVCIDRPLMPSSEVTTRKPGSDFDWSNIRIICIRGYLHDTGATFAPERVHSGSSHGSIFVYMISPQNAMPGRVTPA